MNRAPSRTVFAVALSLLLLPASAWAAAGLKLPHSGYVLNASDQPLTTTGVSMTFRLLDKEAAVLWKGTCSVPVKNGYYAVVLGGDCGSSMNELLLPPGQLRSLSVVIDGVTLSPPIDIQTRIGIPSGCVNGQVLGRVGNNWTCVTVATNNNTVTLGNTETIDCVPALAGTLRWDGTVFQGCNGSVWTSFANAVVVPPPAAIPPSLTPPAGGFFGTVAVGSSSVPQTFTLTNLGTEVLSIASITSGVDFQRTTTCPIAPSTLAVSGSCTIDVTFSPTTDSPSAKMGFLTVSYGAAGGSSISVPLSGTAQAAAPALVYATWDATLTSFGYALSNGNLTATGSGNMRATLGKDTGKWYWEIHHVSGGWPLIGVVTGAAPLTSNACAACNNFTGHYSYETVGLFYANSNLNPVTFTPTYDPGDTLGFALDMENHSLTFYVNCVVANTYNAIPATTMYPHVGVYGGGTRVETANFGASAFTCAVPAGFNAGVYQ